MNLYVLVQVFRNIISLFLRKWLDVLFFFSLRLTEVVFYDYRRDARQQDGKKAVIGDLLGLGYFAPLLRGLRNIAVQR